MSKSRGLPPFDLLLPLTRHDIELVVLFSLEPVTNLLVGAADLQKWQLLVFPICTHSYTFYLLLK
jgi:hypothetical protein